MQDEDSTIDMPPQLADGVTADDRALCGQSVICPRAGPTPSEGSITDMSIDEGEYEQVHSWGILTLILHSAWVLVWLSSTSSQGCTV